jgi:hypothetical protein
MTFSPICGEAHTFEKTRQCRCREKLAEQEHGEAAVTMHLTASDSKLTIVDTKREWLETRRLCNVTLNEL